MNNNSNSINNTDENLDMGEEQSEGAEIALNLKSKPEKTDYFHDKSGFAWYVVYAMGYEDKIKQQILKRVENMCLKDKVGEVFVPKKTVTKVKGGKRIEKDVPHYQRYLFVNMILDEDTFRAVRNTPGVLNIIDKPLSQFEVARLFGRKRKKFAETTEEGTEFSVEFSQGDEVKIEGGAFDGFVGTASSIDLEHGKVTVMISVFGRMTPVDLTIDQVHPVN